MSKKIVLLLVLALAASALLLTVQPISSVSVKPAENTWTQKAPMQQARHGLGVAVVDGKIYAIGGYAESGIVGTNEEYDPATNKWTNKAPMPTARVDFAMALYENKVYCIGGTIEDNKGIDILTAANEVYDPVADKWENKTAMPTAKLGRYASVNVVGGKIYFTGGYPNGTDNEVYDPSTDTWTTKTPNPVSGGGSSVVFNNKICIFGWYFTGIVGHNYRSVNQIYDPIADTWSSGTPWPKEAYTRVYATTGIMVPRRVYVFGGGFNQVYNPESDSWTFGATDPTSRGDFAVTTIDDIIYVIGGWEMTTPPPAPWEAGGPFPTGVVMTAHATVEAYTPFGYGTIPPIIEIALPESANYTAGEVQLNFNLNRNVTWTGYSLDGQNNVTATGNITLTGLALGSHNVTVYATDEYGNTGTSETINFTITPKPEPFPTAPIAAVSGASAFIAGAGLFVYFKKRRH